MKGGYPLMEGVKHGIAGHGAGSFAALPLLREPWTSLADEELRAVSADDLPWAHRSACALGESPVLVVDEVGPDLDTTRSFLAALGYRCVAHARHPTEALAAMRREPPRLTLLAMRAPGLLGMTLLSAMREDPVLRHVPVLVVDATGDEHAAQRALTTGAADCLTLPVAASELALRTRNLLAAHAYRDYVGQHDHLTGLPMKGAFRRTVAQVMAEATAGDRTGALLLVGTDALGQVNDALGRIAGDQLLQRIAKRLGSCVRTEAGGELSSERHDPTVFRLDGDEFAIIVPHMEDGHGAASFINKVLEDGTATLHPHGGPELFVTCSVGVSVFPRDATDPESLLRYAGLALRHAKQGGPHRYEFYSPVFGQQAQRRLDLSAELRHALRRDQIELLYEPVIDLGSGRVVGAQTVVRWRHGSGHMIEGDELMDLAGRSEMDIALTEWVFDHARRHVRSWRAAGLQPVRLVIKASLAHMQVRDLVHLLQAATSSGIDAGLLSLELQQADNMAALTAKDQAVIASLRRKGVRLVVDRFGGRRGTLGHLRQLPYDELKVDAMLLQGVENDPFLQSMLLGINDIAKRLRLASIACGIDTPQKLDFVRKHGWDRAHGALFGEPLDGLAFAAKWLTRGGKPQRALLSGEGA